jgi:hypothetical protein
MGHLALDRSITSARRAIYKGRSIFVLEEPHDPSGWKASVWIEPERDFIVSRYLIVFRQKIVVDIEIDYAQDPKWGWIPSGWQVLQMKADGSVWQAAVAKIVDYRINMPIGIEEFR